MTAVYTRPKYIEAQRKREKPVLLEERLWEFTKWLAEHHVRLHWKHAEPLSGTEIDKLIQEYVNS
jgi:hypothetical protein